METATATKAVAEFKQLKEHTTGPLLTRSYALEPKELASVLRGIERDRRLRVDGFRLGRSPLFHWFKRHRRVLEQELLSRLRRQLAKSQAVEIKQALLPPEFTVHPWDGQGALVIEARWIRQPSMPQPGGKFAGMMQGQESQPPGAPPLPQPGPGAGSRTPQLPGVGVDRPAALLPQPSASQASPAAGASLPQAPAPGAASRQPVPTGTRK